MIGITSFNLTWYHTTSRSVQSRVPQDREYLELSDENVPLRQYFIVSEPSDDVFDIWKMYAVDSCLKVCHVS